ncbi:MAG: circularly permuted type 2 ATP-grasp protein, partial [Planctomycetota bacterium]
MISPRQPTKEKPAAGDVSPLLEGYKPPAGVFDELVDSAGGVRNSYTPLMASFAALGAAGLARRWEAGRRLIQEQGITFNTQGEGGGQSRQWQLDPVPLVISPADWAHLERGLVQRATLINLILADCYGAQNLLRQGRIPPGLLYAQPDFLRPCVGIKPAGGVFLNLYAADVGRSPDGRWWVLSDRTQIPTGAGYALENRIVTSRTLPEPFRAMNVRRLAGFFRVLQQSLGELSPRPGDQPRVAVLTPGPFNE